jgi:hypothetical protein
MTSFQPEPLEPIKNIKFTSSQNWFGKTIDKTTVRFETEEDLQLMILNTFVHDFGHDYNFLNDGYLKRIVSNVKELESLGINIGGSILKTLVDIISGEPRKIYMYNDNNFEDVDDALTPDNEFLQRLANKKKIFHNQLKTFELPISSPLVGGALSIPRDDYTVSKLKRLEKLKKDDVASLEDASLEDASLEPSLSPLTIDISKYIKNRSENADSLTILSTLKLYITSYLGPNYYTSLIPDDKLDGDVFYNYYMHYSIITTFYGLICYYNDLIEEDLIENSETRVLTRLFADLLLLLLASYLKVVDDIADKDPFTVLDSYEVMNQFNRFFAEYVQATDVEFDAFSLKIMSKIEFIYETDERNGNKPGELEGGANDETKSVEKRYTYVKREYGIFHNNLLTTVTRGIFLKTGVWQKIYPVSTTEKAADFTKERVSEITKDMLLSRGFVNDLLIAEILILKHMLMEIFPDFLYLANGIDDKLKAYLDIYLYKCGKYNMVLKPLSEEDKAIIEYVAPPPLSDFIVADEEEDEEQYDKFPRGGANLRAANPEGEMDFASVVPAGLTRIPDSNSIIESETPVEIKKERQLSTTEIQRAFDVNSLVVQNLRESGIPPIQLGDGTQVSNMFELLKMNTGMIQRVGSEFAYPAPKKRFILDNASKLTRNVNGMKLFHNINALDDLKKTVSEEEYNELLRKFRLSQKVFGLYKTLKRGVLCAGSSMMDAMDNCSLEKGATEPKEIGTTNYEFVFEDTATGVHLSYGGVVLFYTGSNNDSINVHIDFSLKTKLVGQKEEDVAHVIVEEMDVADSEDLKARIVYKSVIKRVDSLFKRVFRFEDEGEGEYVGEIVHLRPAKYIQKKREKMIEKMKTLWSFLQFNPYLENNDTFNKLLEATGVKNLGDLLQEIQGTIKWGGYVNSVDALAPAVKEFITRKGIEERNIIYRSVSSPNSIIPYDQNGNALRFAVEGDRPSAFRAIYFLLFGESDGINLMALAGYLQAGRSIIVARNEPAIIIDEIPPVIPYPAIAETADTSSLAEPPLPPISEPRAPSQESSALTVETLSFKKCPPFGKVIFVNAEEKNISVKNVEISDPKIKQPKILESNITPGRKKPKPKSKPKSRSRSPSLSPTSAVARDINEVDTEEQKEKNDRDRADLIRQMAIGDLIPSLSVLKNRVESVERTAELSREIANESIKNVLGGKTRKTIKNRVVRKKKITVTIRNHKNSKNSKKSNKTNKKKTIKKHKKRNIVKKRTTRLRC